MSLPKIVVLAAALAVVSSRSVFEANSPYNFVLDGHELNEEAPELYGIVKEVPEFYEPVYQIHNLGANNPYNNLLDENVINEDFKEVPDVYEAMNQNHYSRAKRQAHGLVNTNPDGSANILAKVPLAGNSNNILSATGSIEGAKPGGFSAAGAGLSLDNINGHALSISGKHIPGLGDQLTGAGKVNLINTDRHNLNANAFVTRTMPTIPNVPNFNTHGGSVDYTYNNKLGASLGISQTPLFQKTDVSAMGNLNLFRDRTQSLDFNAGATRSFSPFIPKSSWQPTFGMSYSRYF